MGASDIDDDTITVELFSDEGGIDHEGCAVHRLRRAEHGTTKGMGNHDMVANFDGEQERSPKVSAKSFCKVFLQSLSARSFCKVFLQGLSARSFCKVFLQGLSARSFCKVFLQGLSARSF
jgi:hypothetical protein